MSKTLWLLGAAYCALLLGQDDPDRVTVPFRDQSKPGTLRVDLINGSVTVRGYDGKDAVIESSGKGRDRVRRHARDVPPGMHRIDNSGSGLEVVEDNNVISIKG